MSNTVTIVSITIKHGSPTGPIYTVTYLEHHLAGVKTVDIEGKLLMEVNIFDPKIQEELFKI